MTDQASIAPALPRVATGIPGLDAITGGGFLRSGVYILQGAPGAGKTILANQVVHGHAARGGKVVYVTLLAESHARLLQHMGGFDFFQSAAVPERIYYVSAFNALRTGGLKGVVDLLRAEMRGHQAGFLVLDGLVMAASAAADEEAMKLFISEVQAHSTLTGCTTLLLTSDPADRPISAEHTMVDGILLLRERAYGPMRERNLEVLKFRGSGTLRGNHAFCIDGQGITVYPRLEALVRSGPGDAVRGEGLSTGVAGLDRMFDIGGYARGSVTALSGPSGSGKTSVALHFLAGARPGEKCLFFGFYESPELLARIAAMQGIDPVKCFAPVTFIWNAFGENLLDELARQLLAEVERSRPARVVIDGVGGLVATPGFADRGGNFLVALMNELRRLGATTLVTVERNEASRALLLDTPTMSAIADTALELELRQQGVVQRFATIRKTRVSLCDRRQRELVLTPAGLAVLEDALPAMP